MFEICCCWLNEKKKNIHIPLPIPRVPVPEIIDIMSSFMGERTIEWMRRREIIVHQEDGDSQDHQRKDTPENASLKVPRTPKQENPVEKNTLVASKVDPSVKHLDLW